MKATSESSSNLGSPISMRDVLIRVWDQGYQSPHFRRSRFRPDGVTFRITIACRQFPYSAAFTTNINWKKSRLEKFRMSYLRSTGWHVHRHERPQRVYQDIPIVVYLSPAPRGQRQCRTLRWTNPSISK